MYELIQAAERSYYIQSPAKIGLVQLEGQDVCLIDSVSDKDAVILFTITWLAPLSILSTMVLSFMKSSSR